MNRLKELRNKKGETLEELKSSLEKNGLKLSTGQLSSYENGKRAPRNEDIWENLADYFGVSVSYLLGYSEYEKDPMSSSLELARKDNTGEYVDLQDMVTLMDLALLKGVDNRDKILSNLKSYYDYNGVSIKQDLKNINEEDFAKFLKDRQQKIDDHIIMLLTGILELRDELRLTILDLLTLEGEKLQTIKSVIKLFSHSKTDSE